MTPRERVRAAFEHNPPDYPPCDYFGTPEIYEALYGFFKTERDDELRGFLGTDIRYITPPYTGPELPVYDDGSFMNEWGVIKKPMANEYGDYAEAVNLPYKDWQTVEEAEKFDWPSPDWYDYDAIPELCAAYPDHAIAVGSFSIQDFINNTAYGRGVEQVLYDIALEDPVYLYIVEKRHRFYLEHVERMLKAGGGRIDMLLMGDDFGTQRGLLISPASFDSIFARRKKELCDLTHSYGAFVSHHSCGSTVDLWPRFIEAGMDAIQTIQPQAVGMNPYELKKKYGDKITLHGAMDVQGWLQKTTPEDIEKEVFHLLEEVGKDGGYILSPSHNIQPDTPLENVLAMYRAVKKYRGETPTF